MLLRFTKMHGLGNDFVVIDAITQEVQVTEALARRLADRRFGIGCDQVLVVEPPTDPDVDFNYRIFNADGGEVEQCGNGARCFAKFVRDRRLTGKHHILAQTKAGVLQLTVNRDNQITVNMGVPRFAPQTIPFQAEQPALLYELQLDDQVVHLAALSMGNPHAVVQVQDITTAPVATLGARIESHPRFAQRVNAGFMQIISRTEIKLRVYERGVGETLACGSGACAAVVAGIQQDLLDSTVTVHLTGGDLHINWPGEGQPVAMTGPATTVYQGRIKI